MTSPTGAAAFVIAMFAACGTDASRSLEEARSATCRDLRGPRNEIVDVANIADDLRARAEQLEEDAALLERAGDATTADAVAALAENAREQADAYETPEGEDDLAATARLVDLMNRLPPSFCGTGT